MARKADRASADAEQPLAEEQPPKKKGKLLLVLAPALLTGLLSGGALGVAQTDTLARVHALVERAQAAPADGGEAAADAQDAPEEEDPEAFGSFAEMTGLIVNPAGTNGDRYLMVNLAFEGSEESIAEYAAREVVIKDRVLDLLAERSVDQLADYTYRDSLKQQLRAAANGVLKTGTISRLYFTQYVLQ